MVDATYLQLSMTDVKVRQSVGLPVSLYVALDTTETRYYFCGHSKMFFFGICILLIP